KVPSKAAKVSPDAGDRVEVLVLPIPELNAEAEVVEPPDPFEERKLRIEEFGVCRQPVRPSGAGHQDGVAARTAGGSANTSGFRQPYGGSPRAATTIPSIVAHTILVMLSVVCDPT